MAQVPAMSNDAVVLETVHTVGVEELKVTVRPEVAVAARVSVERAFWAGIGPNAMVCDSRFTVKLCMTGVAAA